MKRAIQRQGSAEEAGSPKSFWSLQIDKNSSEFAKRLRRPVPCEQGAADLWATASSADLRFSFSVSYSHVVISAGFGICDYVSQKCFLGIC